MALISKLEAIGNAIREKTGKSDLLSLDDMATEITNLSTGGGGDLPEEAYSITGDCQYKFAHGGWDWFIRDFGSKVETSDINNCLNMFINSKVEYIPFDINCKTGTEMRFTSMFDGCLKLKEAPRILGKAKPSYLSNLFTNCQSLETIPDDFTDGFDWSYIDSLNGAYAGGQTQSLFAYCYRLRKVPMDFFRHGNPTIAYTYSSFSNLFQSCFSLDEVRDLPNIYINAGWTSNCFGNSFNYCYRVKEITFALQEDGSPYVANWKKQTIDLTRYVGYISASGSDDTTLKFMNPTCNTLDKEVVDDATYQALKDDPDWFTRNVAYSRYNHDSAVNTINSLPDCSALGENTIKFKGASGSATDGGAINTLTEEEIAVAAAKGWTVSLT